MKFKIEFDDKDLEVTSIDMDGVVLHTEVASANKTKYIVLLIDELRTLYEECDAQHREDDYGKR